MSFITKTQATLPLERSSGEEWLQPGVDCLKGQWAWIKSMVSGCIECSRKQYLTCPWKGSVLGQGQKGYILFRKNTIVVSIISFMLNSLDDYWIDLVKWVTMLKVYMSCGQITNRWWGNPTVLHHAPLFLQEWIHSTGIHRNGTGICRNGQESARMELAWTGVDRNGTGMD